ncbi:MAG: Rrf2 family transcriptional regulator [Planctomycetes bacterium]|nr:Rrf2 family transcriptional regulator [Planctomycetota bacterium]
MIRFSKMADYGVLLLGHFARHEGDLASAAELADTYHMPKTVVANLLKSFREAGLLESRRGVSGGYRLVCDPSAVSLLDVLRVIEGPVQLTECVASSVLTSCEYEDVCLSKSPMRAVNRRIVELLDGITLAQLIKESDPLPASP